MKLCVLMPVYNEREALKEILDMVLAQRIEGIDGMEVVIVDDASTDGTHALVGELAGQSSIVKAVFHERNRGKGASVRTALDHADGDIAIIQDADLEYDPGDYSSLLGPLLDGSADAVYGSRFLREDSRRSLKPLQSLANRVLTWLSNALTGLGLTDMETCYKAMALETLRSLHLESDGFDIEPEITAKIAQRGLRVLEVPIGYCGRSRSEGKKIGWRDGLRALWVILRQNVGRRRPT